MEAAELFAHILSKYRPHLRYEAVDPCRLEVAEWITKLIALLVPVMRDASEAEVLREVLALYRQLVVLDAKPLEESFFELVHA